MACLADVASTACPEAAFSIYNMLLHSLSSTASSSVSPFLIDSIHPFKKESRPDLFRSIV